jgi:hypothetical protein
MTTCLEWPRRRTPKDQANEEGEGLAKGDDGVPRKTPMAALTFGRGWRRQKFVCEISLLVPIWRPFRGDWTQKSEAGNQRPRIEQPKFAKKGEDTWKPLPKEGKEEIVVLKIQHKRPLRTLFTHRMKVRRGKGEELAGEEVRILLARYCLYPYHHSRHREDSEATTDQTRQIT